MVSKDNTRIDSRHEAFPPPLSIVVMARERRSRMDGIGGEKRTLLDAVLLGLALALLLVNPLDTLVKVVLGRRALGRVLAL